MSCKATATNNSTAAQNMMTNMAKKNVIHELACRKVFLFRHVVGAFWPIVTFEPVHNEQKDKI